MANRCLLGDDNLQNRLVLDSLNLVAYLAGWRYYLYDLSLPPTDNSFTDW
jgi:hypothetical protein